LNQNKLSQNSQKSTRKAWLRKLLSRIKLMPGTRFAYWTGIFACFMGTLMALGCGGGSASSQAVTAKTLSSLAIKPASVSSIVLGSSQQFTATGTYSDGSTQDVTDSVSWTSSAPAVATISASGLATALAVGPTNIGASMSSISASAVSMTVVAQGGLGALGSAVASSTTCPASPLGNSTCYSVALTCPDIDNFTGYVKVTPPTSGTAAGTVVLTTGGAGDTLYESFEHGITALDTLLQAGFTLAQISWGQPFTTTQPSGWVTGPGGTRAAACRFATLAQWIYNNIHLANTSSPFCATGNSSGSAEIGLALAHYNMGSIFAMVEPTSGPPYSRQDWACDCLQPGPATDPCGNPNTTYCAGTSNAQLFIDPAYAAPVSCSYETEHQPTTTYDPIFLNDSILSPDATLNYPQTFVNFRYGSADLSGAPNQGQLWYNAITSSKAESCVQGAPHSIPDDLAGAQAIAQDIVTNCKLQ
jgi:hypothetical protein